MLKILSPSYRTYNILCSVYFHEKNIADWFVFYGKLNFFVIGYKIVMFKF